MYGGEHDCCSCSVPLNVVRQELVGYTEVWIAGTTLMYLRLLASEICKYASYATPSQLLKWVPALPLNPASESEQDTVPLAVFFDVLSHFPARRTMSMSVAAKAAGLESNIAQ